MALSDLKKLHDKGMALIYLREKEKRPLEEGWTTQPRKKWDELEASYNKKYNVGVRLGSPSKLISGNFLGAIDCDVKASSRKAKLEMNDTLRALGIDLDNAPIVMSGRGNGSKHIYVQTPTPMVPLKYAQSQNLCKVKMPSSKPSRRDEENLSADEIAAGYRIRPAWEISFMGDGQQTVLPPSIHPDTGAHYAWANPLSVKYLPTFKPEKFVSQITKKIEALDLDFKAEDVNLYETNLPIQLIKIVESGEGCTDRSASLFSVALSMCRLGFSDNQILSVLSDPENWIASAAYDHTQSNNRGRAIRWLNKYTLTKARYETDIMRRFESKPERKPLSEKKIEAVSEELQELVDRTLPDLGAKGQPKSTLRNIIHILEVFMEGKIVAYDEFANRIYFTKDTAYGCKKGAEIKDADDLSLKLYVANHFGFEPSKELCYEAHTLVAMRYAYHPVKDYLGALKWDGVPRLDTWLERAFGATGPLIYVRAVGRKTLTGAVARIYEPGVKFDHVLTLEGMEGKGKSTTLNMLAGLKWFTDDMRDLHNKDVVDQMAGKWIVEIGELASLKRADNEFIKAFLSRRTDRVRLAYGRRSADFPRSCIFIGTTNAKEWLNDENGNRRFWPVRIKQADFKWIDKNRDQLWAEARMRYELGEDLYLDEPTESLARLEQAKRLSTDEWQDAVTRYLDTLDGDKRCTSTDVWRAVENTPMGYPDDRDTKRIGRVMRILGFERRAIRIQGSVVKGWINKREVKS